MDERARAWVAAATGASRVEMVRSLAFGVSSDVALVSLDGRRLVLRRYDRPEVVAERDDIVGDEVQALRAAAAVLGAIVPEVVAYDSGGGRAGVPSVLMTFVPGRVRVHDLEHVDMAGLQARLHAAPVPDLPDYEEWFERDRLAVPADTRAPHAWSRLVDALRGPAPVGNPVFLHRDYHPGNLLWSAGRISGLVDWASASVGPAGVDVAHTRVNLALLCDVRAADDHLARYLALRHGYEHDPWFDAAALCGLSDAYNGQLALNAFGADLDIGMLRARADRYAEAIAARLEG